MTLVSIIMPVYNAMPFLKDAVKTVLEQDYKSIELICVDDGSTDDSFAFLCNCAQNDARVKVLQQSNSGAGVARNFGLSIAKGDYVFFLDADDIFYSTLVSSAVEVAEKYQSDIVVYRFESYDMNNGKKTACDYAFQKENWNKNIINRFDNPDKILTSFNPCAWNKMFKKNFITEHSLSFQNNKRTNDLYFVSCAMATANTITLLDKVLVAYRIGNDNSSQSTNSVAALDFYKALLAVKSYLIEKNMMDELHKSFLNLCENTIIHNLKKSGDGGIAVYTFMKKFGFHGLGIDTEDIPKLKSFLSRYSILDFKERMRESSKVKATVLREGKKSNNIKVSVVIPVYNVEDYLEDCLKSVSCQSLKDIEIIAVNDGSTDASRDILLKYFEIEPRLTILDQKNAGLSMARNNGRVHSIGEYIYFFDSDDMISKTALEELYNKAVNEKLDVLFFDAEAFFDDGIENNHQGYGNYYERSHDYSMPRSGRKLLCDMQKNNEYRPSVPLQFINRLFYVKNKLSFYPGLLYEDNLFTFKELLVAQRSAHVNKKYYKRRLRSDSIITSKQKFTNAYCYFICWQEVSKLIRLDASFSEFVEVKDILNRLKKAYERIYKGLSDDEKQNIVFLDPIDKQYWTVSIKNNEKENVFRKTYHYFLNYGLSNTLKKILSKFCVRM